jgi:hypothetical protein
MPQDPIGDLRKKRQREQQVKEISRYQDDAPYKSARERVSKGKTQSLEEYYLTKSSEGKEKRAKTESESGQARMASPERLSRLSAQSADHRQQTLLERPDTPLAATPEPKRK